MKKSIWITVAIVCCIIISSLIINQLVAQPTQKGSKTSKPIPANVMKIAEKSCVKCHTEPGNPMAIMHLNLSSWDKYSTAKQADKAKAMCTMVTKDKMPPKSFKEKNPNDVPSQEETNTICNWAQSIQLAK